MSASEKEFFVIEVVEGQQCRAMGRCGDVTLRVGDAFDSLYEYDAPASPDAFARKANRLNGEMQVALRVDAIQAYGRQLDHLSPGMTGTLLLSGTGCQHLKAGLVLGPAHAQNATSCGALADVKQA